MIGAPGYFVGTQVTTNQQAGLQALAALPQQIAALQSTLVELVHTNRQQMEAGIQAQMRLLHQRNNSAHGKSG